MHEVERVVGDEMAGRHDMQMQEILSPQINYLDIHFPECRPTFKDNTRLVILMGHIDEVYKEALRLKKLNDQRKK